MRQKIHIFGASGSGTSTIAEAICQRLGYKHFDTDSYYWYPTKDPFTEARPVEERLQLMNADLANEEKWVLSGSLFNWGDPLIPLFDLVIFVYVPQNERIERLKKREYKRYGDEVLPGGNRYEVTKEFIEWAAGYESGLLTGRSLPKHEQWMSTLDCQLVKIINHSLDDSVDEAIAAIDN